MIGTEVLKKRDQYYIHAIYFHDLFIWQVLRVIHGYSATKPERKPEVELFSLLKCSVYIPSHLLK